MLGIGKNTVEIIIAAKDRTSAAFAKVNTQMKTMGGATGKLKSSMGGLTSKMSALATSMNPVAIAAGAAAIALATMGGAAIKASLDFEKASATIRVGTGATGDALAGLEQSFKTVYTSVPASTADAATAIADLNTRLGLTGEPLEALASQFLNLSRITGTDVAASISSATRVMHDFAVSSEEQSGALDYLFKVSQSTGIGMTNLANNMTRYGGVMRQMGFNINTSAALLGKFEKEGVNLELVLSSLRMGLAKFARAGEEPVEALKRVISEIQGMGSAADRNLKAIEIFGARSGPDMAAAIYEGRFSIEELMGTLEASSETINKAAADTMTFGDKWTLLKNQMMGAIAPIGDVITNALTLSAMLWMV
jgi:TP901 family phage tail tape measure protein